VISGIELPLEAAVLLCAVCALVGGWLGHLRIARRLRKRDPLKDLFRPENLRPAVDLAHHRNARRHASHAVLHGRIDQFAADSTSWSDQTCDEVRAHVAAVMRVGLRRQDRIALGEGAGFTILIPGADERAAVHIAERLRRTLQQLRLPQLGHGINLTASFGVAADRFGENHEALEGRARRALATAVAQGADRVVPASEVEETLLLPAPADSDTAASAA
jgi:diguanylate cyclase (GGDEF)-like protein